MIFICSMIEPGHPWVTIRASIFVLRTNVNEVDGQPIDLGDEIRQCFELRFDLAPSANAEASIFGYPIESTCPRLLGSHAWEGDPYETDSIAVRCSNCYQRRRRPRPSNRKRISAARGAGAIARHQTNRPAAARPEHHRSRGRPDNSRARSGDDRAKAHAPW